MKKKTIMLMAAALMTAALAGCSKNNQETKAAGTVEAGEETESTAAGETETKAQAAEEEKTKLVIAGGDGAGLAAAIQAVSDGLDPASILIAVSGEELGADLKQKEAFLNAANTSDQFEAEIEDDSEIYLADILAAGNQKNDEEMAAYLSENGEEAMNWLKDLGITFGELKQEEGSSVARSHYAASGKLNELTADALVQKVEELKIPIEKNTTVKSIRYGAEGEVTGVTLVADGTETELSCVALVAADPKLLPLFEDARVTSDKDGKANGLLVTACAEVMNASEEVLPGLYAVGDLIAPGVHGEQAVAGDELTAAIVFGTTAGTESAIYVGDNK